MIADRIIVSARTGNDNAPRRRVVRGILMAAMAAILPLSSPAAWAMENPDSKMRSHVFEGMSLPPNPALDSAPWSKRNSGVKIDTLLSPILNPSGIKLGPYERDKEQPAFS